MEYVFNHSLANDTSRVPDRRMRPHSAFIPTESYYKQKGSVAEDDVGRPVLQHKPLAKGEFTQLSLAKVFEDDPGMRPKVFAHPTVNKISYGLMSRDVEGAVPQLQPPPNKIRDTNPMQPIYILPGSSTLAAEAAAAAAAAAASETQQRPQHSSLDVADINAVPSVSERPHKLATRNTQLNTSDILGSWPGWEPPFRAHVGKNLRDPGLDVRDISGTYARRRVSSARPTVGGRDGSGGGGSRTVAAAAAAAPMPAWQQPQPQPAPQLPDSAAAAPPPSCTPLPLRPPISAPPYATYPPSCTRTADGSALDRTTAAAAEPLASTVGKPHPAARNPSLRHSAKRAAADAQLAAAAEAQRVIASLNPSKEAVEAFWHNCRRMDREVCGKLSPGDFTAALQRANVLAADSSNLPGSGGSGEVAAAAALVRGLQDGSGMVSYRSLARELLGRTPSRGSSAGSGGAIASAGAAAAKGAKAAAGSGAARRPASATPTVSASRPVSSGSGGSGSAASQAPPIAGGQQQRNVYWAPEYGPAEGATPPPTAGRSGSAGSGGPPPPPYHPHPQQQYPQQQQQYQYPQQQTPQPNAPTNGTAAGSSSITAQFNLSNNDQPTAAQPSQQYHPHHPPPPPPPHPSSPSPPPSPPQPLASTQQPPTSSSSHRPPSPTLVNTTAATTSDSAAAAAAAAAAMEPLGLGPGWPPSPHQDPLQRRSAATVTANTGVTLRFVEDTNFFPFKSHPYWFGGRGPAPGPDGGEPPGAGGPAEAAREYQPSEDITSFIVGKGHHRITGGATGGRLDAAAEAAVVARLRPYSAASGAEAAALAHTPGAIMRQLQLDGPMLYVGEPNPAAAAGSSLKGASAALFAASRPPPTGPRLGQHSRARPSSVPPRAAAWGARSGGAGAGEPRVGRAAAERQMLREEIAAVRRLP
ncbi:hypothetical protein Agub_g14148 [Astrephomene gubernaculifera]|uniref:EF-hand domain-containing protein n=1 Tax=Astrephomene gubernaculifera TaxID=47775 RepID=A0AAD3E1E4_9CHLO|nr:hypothetical protein Agub_g14148 [Astrephomene gubernaculifera]